MQRGKRNDKGEGPGEDHNHIEQALLIKDNLVVTLTGVYGKTKQLIFTCVDSSVVVYISI